MFTVCSLAAEYLAHLFTVRLLMIQKTAERHAINNTFVQCDVCLRAEEKHLQHLP